MVHARSRSRRMEGRLLPLVALLYGTGRFFLDFLRATDVAYADAPYLGSRPRSMSAWSSSRMARANWFGGAIRQGETAGWSLMRSAADCCRSNGVRSRYHHMVTYAQLSMRRAVQKVVANCLSLFVRERNTVLAPTKSLRLPRGVPARRYRGCVQVTTDDASPVHRQRGWSDGSVQSATVFEAGGPRAQRWHIVLRQSASHSRHLQRVNRYARGQVAPSTAAEIPPRLQRAAGHATAPDGSIYVVDPR